MNENEKEMIQDILLLRIAVEKKAQQSGASVEDVLFSTVFAMSKFFRDRKLQGEFGEYSAGLSFDLAKIGDSDE